MLLIVIPLIIIGGVPFAIGAGMVGCIAYKELTDLSHDKKNNFPNIIKIIGLICLILIMYTNYEKYGLLFGLSYKVLAGTILALTIICNITKRVPRIYE